MWKGEEAAFAKNGTLPDPEGIANPKFVLQLIKDSSPIDAAKRTHMAKYCKCVSEETMTEKRMEKNEEVKEEEMMGGDDPLRKRVGRMTCLAKVSTMGRRFGKCTLMDPRYCDWTVRQDRPLMWKLRCFKYCVRRVSDLNGKRIGKRMKEDDVEVKMLEACCEENAEKLEEATRGRRVQWANLA